MAEGIPCVVSESIDWVPEEWHASIDDPSDVANKLISVLHDPMASQTAANAIKKYVDNAVGVWTGWLTQFSH
jgi:hypothetical protein